MPRGTPTKIDMKYHVLKLMDDIYHENCSYETKELAKKYLNLLLDKIHEYAR